MAGLLRPAPPPTHNGKRRRTLNETLDDLIADPSNAILDETASIAKEAKVSLGFLRAGCSITNVCQDFRVGSGSLLSRLDRTLREYRKLCLLKFKRDPNLAAELVSEDVETDDNDHLFFPAGDIPAFYQNVFFYLVSCCPLIQPQSRRDTTIRLGTLIERRFAMLRWAQEKIGHARIHRGEFLHQSNKAVMLAAKKYGITSQSKPKEFFGRDELRYLLDYDFSTTDYPEVAQNFAISWILGCVCGVRPGAISVSPHRKGFLSWGDLHFSRQSGDDFKFQVRITFRSMKGFHDDSAYRTARSSRDGSLQMTIRSPQTAENLPLSLPHRLLIIGISRQVFEV